MPHKLGILGGTFNPVHRGHIELGLSVRAAFGLEKILYILSASPPHKRLSRLPPADFRYRMLRKALAGHSGLVPSDMELHRHTLSWTIDTVEELQHLHPRTEFYFITGSEGFLTIRTWKEYRRLLHLIFFIIALRKKTDSRYVSAILHQENIPLATVETKPDFPPGAFLHLYRSENLLLSSTQIRRLARQGKDIRSLTAPGIETILEEFNPYEKQ